jgi:hypothetical protein
MALDSTALTDALVDVFENMPASKEDAAAAIAQAYFDYASDGQFSASAATPTEDYRDAMAGTLATGLTVPGLPLTIAAAFAAAVATFWTGVPVVGAQAGATVGCPGASALTGALSAVFANLANTAATCGAAVANALHTATLTVTAAVSPGPTPLTII